MDRDEALELLGGGPEGIAEWNRRRLAGERIPNLLGANLIGARFVVANLDGVNLDGATLDEANLSRANLARANLNVARLVSASLARANLYGAALVGADLAGADLEGANLRGANLEGANLKGANLEGANLEGAFCRSTILANLDFSQVKGLDSVEHQGPSTLGTDTLIRSRGKIPEVFLRGCGLPDAWIKYLPSLIGSMSPIQFHSCFISHSHEDEAFAKRLHAGMREEGLRVWYAPEDMKGGRKLLDQIEGAIHVQDKLLLVLSEASMRSGWVETELRSAFRREQREQRQIIFPIRITSWEPVRDWKCFDADTGRDLARAVREYHIPDFSLWKEHDDFEAAFARLLDDLKADVGKPTPSA